ncbi:MAG: hypothetical protein R2709_13085 [Marmoricola sp.]
MSTGALMRSRLGLVIVLDSLPPLLRGLIDAHGAFTGMVTRADRLDRRGPVALAFGTYRLFTDGRFGGTHKVERWRCLMRSSRRASC